MGKLIRIEKSGRDFVYDLEIEGEHNFSVSGICVHNSSKNPNF